MTINNYARLVLLCFLAMLLLCLSLNELSIRFFIFLPTGIFNSIIGILGIITSIGMLCFKKYIYFLVLAVGGLILAGMPGFTFSESYVLLQNIL